MRSMKALPSGTVKITVNVASQVRIFPNAYVMKKNGFRAHASGTFTIRQEDGHRFGYFTQLEQNDHRNDGKKHTGIYKIQHETGWSEFTINVGKFVKDRLVPVSKGTVDSWIVGPGCLRVSMPHRFRKEKGSFADPDIDPDKPKKSARKLAEQEHTETIKLRMPDENKRLDTNATGDVIEHMEHNLCYAEREAIRLAFGWRRKPA